MTIVHMNGFGVRDYIHVVGCKRSYKSIGEIKENPGLVTYNLGTGNGYSVLDLIKAFWKGSWKGNTLQNSW